MTGVTGILLAAGQSRRFGGNKLLMPLADGTPLVVHAARTLREALPRTLIVVNARDKETIVLLKSEGMNIVLNHSAEAGMGKSIACGVQASRRSDGWVVALGDMPCLTTRTILSVVAVLQNPNTISAPAYSDRRGHPVAFGRAYAKELMQLNGDEGARHIIDANRENLKLMETEDSGVITDIDYLRDFHTVFGASGR